MPRWVVADDNQEEASTSEEDSIEEEDEDEGDEGDEEEDAAGPSGIEHEAEAESEAVAPGSSRKRDKISIPLGKLVCHVCGKPGHNAGFVGSVYMDCPNKPCYLCKKSGHTTATCPYRIAPDQESAQPTPTNKNSVVVNLWQRTYDSRIRNLRPPVPTYQVEAAVLRLHARRCTCLQFHPSRDNLVLSGDKQGQVAVWDHMKVQERTVWRLNHVMTNNLAFLPGGDGMSCCSSSSDGTVKVFDIETGVDNTVLNLNPDGWIQGVSNEKNWQMLYGLDVCQSKGIIASGDSKGNIYFVDCRDGKSIATHQIHKKGNKVNSIQFSAIDQNLMVSASNDWTARLCDIRKLSSAASEPSTSKGKEAVGDPIELVKVPHPKVVNSAYFSPVTGKKLLTTCIDNRIRIWNYLLALDQPPDQEIVHSHDFNRYLTPFRAEWDPKDHDERLFVVGRYISEDFGGLALHPVDLMDAGTGRLLQQLKDPNLSTICPVNKVHPRLDMILTGSSRSLYAWTPTRPEEAFEDGGNVLAMSKDANGEVHGSASYVFYDAGMTADAEKKKRKAGSAAKINVDDDDDEPPQKQKVKAKVTVSTKTKQKEVKKKQPASENGTKKGSVKAKAAALKVEVKEEEGKMPGKEKPREPDDDEGKKQRKRKK